MRDMILILDMDTRSSIAVARKLRAQRVYCKIVPGETPLESVLEQDPSGLMWVGSASQSTQTRKFDARLLDSGIPILAMGVASRQMCVALGGSTQGAMLTETTAPVRYDAQLLFEDVSPGDRWFERAERLGLTGSMMVIAEANGCPVAFCTKERPLYGLQFHIERNDPDGMAILLNFALRICNCTAWWSAEAFIERAVEELARVAGEGKLVCAMSGGVDSSACALLAHRAVGRRAQCVFIDTGLMRKDEGDQIEGLYRGQLGLELTRIHAKDRFFARLKGVADQAAKERIVHDEFTRVLLSQIQDEGGILVRGTNYSDILANRAPTNEAPAPFQGLVEPLRELFKDEVRQVGELLGLPANIIHRQPFPSAGLAERILGEVNEERVNLLRSADAIFQEEVAATGQERRLAQYFAVLGDLPDSRFGPTIVLRAVVSGESGMAARLPYDMLERVVERLGQELPSIRRVLYDVTPSESIQRTEGAP